MSQHTTNSSIDELRSGAGCAIWDRHITMPPRQFREASGIGNTKLYELLGSGELESILIGRRRLIILDSYRRLLERRREAPALGRARAPRRRTAV